MRKYGTTCQDGRSTEAESPLAQVGRAGRSQFTPCSISANDHRLAITFQIRSATSAVHNSEPFGQSERVQRQRTIRERWAAASVTLLAMSVGPILRLVSRCI